MSKLRSAFLLLVSNGLTSADLFGLSQNPGVCVMAKCGKELAACLVDSVCRSWVMCTPRCAAGDLACQIRCGDLYHPTDANGAKIDAFSKCTIADNHCVPQHKMSCDLPANARRFSEGLELSSLAGVWYITKGWSPLFDCFDCQVHNFTYDSSLAKPLVGDLKYSVKKDLSCKAPEKCEYLPREVHQRFAQDPANSGHLMNHNNTAEELHYADDWYILAAKKDVYTFIYYCGCNDASCGYGGAVLYTRSPNFKDLSEEDVADIKKATIDAKVEGFTFDGLCTPSATSCSAVTVPSETFHI